MKVSHRDELADTVYKAMIRDSVGKDRYDMKKELSCEVIFFLKLQNFHCKTCLWVPDVHVNQLHKH